MKIAFSTLGCPEWDLAEALISAKDLGFDAIEIRGIEKEIFIPFTKPFLEENIDATIEKIKNMGLEISLLATGVCVGDTVHVESAFGEAMVYINLAQRLGVKYVRIMISNKPQAENCSIESAIVTYRKICDYAKTKGVIPLIETNGDLADSKVMKKFIEKTDRENAGVLWDVHHPYRFFGETPEETYENIGKFVKYIHVKDSIMDNGKLTYKMMGKGDVPVLEALNLLKDNGYDSFVTLEWVKRWEPDLESGGIVFSNFINYIKSVCKI